MYSSSWRNNTYKLHHLKKQARKRGTEPLIVVNCNSETVLLANEYLARATMALSDLS